MQVRTSVVLILMCVFALGGATLGADEMVLTGTVGDAMCDVPAERTVPHSREISTV